MPAGKRPQSNAMMYTLITFVGLFLVSTTIAVIYYVKAEEQRTLAVAAENKLDEIASNRQVNRIGAIVGTKTTKESYLDKMVEYFDQLVVMISGGVAEETSAEVKVANSKQKFNEVLTKLQPAYMTMENEDPNKFGLLTLVDKLKIKIDTLNEDNAASDTALADLQNRFDDAIAETQEKEQMLIAEKEAYQQQVASVKQDYQDLKELTQQTAEQQVKTLMDQWEQARNEREGINQELLKTQAELNVAQTRLQKTHKKLADIVPDPDSDVAAFTTDARIILIDDMTKTVHIDIGASDHVYRGLTFAVYDKNLPIPKDGKGKAEIEVFKVGKNISSARIIASNIKRPIVQDDLAGNVIWDKDQSNTFAVYGTFDLNGDGKTDYDGDEKIKAMVEKWGAKVSDGITVDTDFLILGSEPFALRKPTFEMLEVDPLAMEKYEKSVKKLQGYQDAQEKAKTLAIPVFNDERFLYFIGYKTQSTKAGAFQF